MKWKRLGICSAAIFGAWKLAEHQLIDEEWFMGFEQRWRKYGLSAEKHFITTEDGYILQIFRVTNGESDQTNENNPVILQHGLMDSCYWWIVNGDKSPLVVLARNGHEVWVGNNRGNSFSRLHKYLNPDHDLKYWDFSLEEMGLYDTKAEIDYVKHQTNKDKVAYIGMSQGSTQMLYALTFNNDYYKNNLSIFIGLCPAAKPDYKGDIPLMFKMAENDLYFKVLKYLNKLEFKPSSFFINKITCSLGRIFPKFTEYILKETSEFEPSVNDFTAVQRMGSRFHQGYSLKTLEYWSQIFKKNRFAKYDYGETENLKKYGSVDPPVVDISKIKDVPIAIMVGIHDRLVPIRDSRWIKENIDPSVLKFYNEYNYGHLTFVAAKDACFLDDVQKLLKEFK